MTQMVFRPGDTEKWKGVGYDFEIISEDELDEYLNAGWVEHPSQVVDESHNEELAESANETGDKGEISDGYHTFNELYAHRVRLFSTLMRAFADKAWWSYSHSDGEQWEGWVLAGIDTPEGAVTYHLPESEIPYLPEGTEIEVGKEWDGHTADDVLERLVSLNLPEPKKRGRKPKAGTDETHE